MEEKDRKTHWETVYTNKQPNEMSWTQEIPETSLHFIQSLQLPSDTAILDIGGGDSKLVDHLLAAGYTDITVLDISEKAIEKAQQRLGAAAGKVKWIVADINDFTPEHNYGLWHDRATFHFLTTTAAQEHYLAAARKAVAPGGYAVIGTFSLQGPEKCSGLPVQRYSGDSLAITWQHGFEKMNCAAVVHTTPFNTTQHFTFCSFMRTR
ncbi:methyltransferase family protein [Chitinophaga niastensis]|uniref:Methyltransferase family protein n=1 Tax=Chitinophaga niastensis TaxID=536980 RepID=A0A2P8H8F7_CHINA|nr:class I SAM-dependent methyltransferase [Chitinophaga niastensis]PSL42523.1 methyltransferase family protein [Chitinophaga niastensis]